MQEQTKLRIAFLGDSITLGDGDAEARGWPSRLLAHTIKPPLRAQCYNLGVGGDRLTDITGRWRHDLHTRLAGNSGCGVVIMIGVNDALCAARTNDPLPLDHSDWGAQLTEMVRSIAARLPVLLIGPAPVHEDLARGDGTCAKTVNNHVAQLDTEVRKAASTCGTFFVTMLPLARDRRFQTALAAVDGLHPNGDGYAAISDCLADDGAFEAFLSECKGADLAKDAFQSRD